MIVFSPEESAIIDKIAIDIELERLTPINRTLIELRVAYRIPTGYAGPWPPDKTAIGAYVGPTYLGRPLSATRTQVRTARILDYWRRRYHPSHTHQSSHRSSHHRAA
jgi:hypothetical protein